jgi:hypothetical protein
VQDEATNDIYAFLASIDSGFIAERIVNDLSPTDVIVITDSTLAA